MYERKSDRKLYKRHHKLPVYSTKGFAKSLSNFDPFSKTYSLANNHPFNPLYQGNSMYEDPKGAATLKFKGAKGSKKKGLAGKGKPYKHVVDNNLKFKGRKIYGVTDDKNRVVKVNKALSKKKPLHKRPIKKGASKYPEVLNTITHEILHEKNPKMTEKDAYKKTNKLMKTMPKKQRQKMYNKFK